MKWLLLLLVSFELVQCKAPTEDKKVQVYCWSKLRDGNRLFIKQHEMGTIPYLDEEKAKNPDSLKVYALHFTLPCGKYELAEMDAVSGQMRKMQVELYARNGSRNTSVWSEKKMYLGWDFQFD